MTRVFRPAGRSPSPPAKAAGEALPQAAGEGPRRGSPDLLDRGLHHLPRRLRQAHASSGGKDASGCDAPLAGFCRQPPVILPGQRGIHAAHHGSPGLQLSPAAGFLSLRLSHVPQIFAGGSGLPRPPSDALPSGAASRRRACFCDYDQRHLPADGPWARRHGGTGLHGHAAG